METKNPFRHFRRGDSVSTPGNRGDLVEQALAHAVANPVEAACQRPNGLDEQRPIMRAVTDGESG
jgi:BioD-like phosphotransacetylase family protein